jgi:hypothetical protein
MTLDDFIAQGRLIPETQLHEAVRQLMRDPRFPSLLRLIREERERLVVEVSSPKVACIPASATAMAHCAGGIDALLSLEGQLAQILDAQK